MCGVLNTDLLGIHLPNGTAQPRAVRLKQVLFAQKADYRGGETQRASQGSCRMDCGSRSLGALSSPLPVSGLRRAGRLQSPAWRPILQLLGSYISSTGSELGGSNKTL